jgi:hypothetical protein
LIDGVLAAGDGFKGDRIKLLSLERTAGKEDFGGDRVGLAVCGTAPDSAS